MTRLPAQIGELRRRRSVLITAEFWEGGVDWLSQMDIADLNPMAEKVRIIGSGHNLSHQMTF
jgi:hypothetical protein